MHVIEKETLENAYKPFDVVTNKKGDVGYIAEVSVNGSQEFAEDQIHYAVNWLVGRDSYAWFSHDELTRHANIFVEIAKSSCNSHGCGARHVESLFDNWRK